LENRQKGQLRTNVLNSLILRIRR